ncbi:SusC/RagA family TonB-linked outer membrane protein [Sinomicrobium weinanense]|uniref:TonB-dependent receptor n=1 Tax=Sinomicrobium weinanense TaxID=2842200 RepID=A0A926JU92_9FLAO|nr:TonB-dependent receptor [Sinomicrobium weinanense]MBC9797638.1 TonB-dependent receptor [Sinomicrobium weinanense]MBU3125258.1 TonB-dependent receptor [Sinomicrobium weinanense]
MKTKFSRLLMLLIAFVVHTSFAQEKTITGTVSAEGLPLPGVNILIKGTTSGTQTDFDGNYSIQASPGQILVFTYIGMTTMEMEVGEGNSINVSMTEDAQALDEVIIVGYGTQSKRKLTDNVAKLTSDDISEIPTPGLQNSLSGKAAGVQVTQTNGKVEGGINIRIRGVASIGAGAEPLYVLDGVPLINDNESSTDAPTNPLITLSSNEIESIDILKDASASAIYGSRGANGVVLITTKKGKQGKGTFALNMSHGISRPTNKREWLNADEYIELFTEAAINTYGQEEGTARAEGMFDDLSSGTDWRNREVSTDWQDLALQNGYVTDADLSLSGGNEKTNYFFSGAYHDTKGIIRGNEMERVTARVNLTHQLSDKFRTGANISFSRTEIDRIANDNAFVTPMQAIAQSPLSPAFLDNGDPNPSTLYSNFLLQDKHAFFNTVIRRVTGRAFGEYQFLPFLKFNSDFGYDLYYQTEDSYTGRLAPFQSTNGEAFVSSLGTESYVFSNYLTFTKNIADIHDIEVVAGMEYNNSNRRFESVTGIEFPSDDFQSISSAAEITGGGGERSRNTFLSYFARATYSLHDKYLFKASIRRDGSSRFGKDKQFGTFSSLSAGWILSEENFLAGFDALSFLKLRASWGQTGNANIGNYAWWSLYEAISYNQRPGISPIQAENPFLTWEKVEQYDIGLEYGFWNNRISGEIDYYVKDSDGLILENPLPMTSGRDFITRNVGLIQNKGVEFVLNTRNIVKDDFTWNTSINLSKNKNEVKELPDDGADIITGENIIREGKPLNAFYLIEYAGVDPDNGDALFYTNTTNPDGSLSKETTTNPNEANRIVTGQPFADWIGGLTNTILYKGIDFSFTFQGEWGASIYNAGGVYQSANGDYWDNQSRDQLRRWQQPGDITDVPQARLFGSNGVTQSTRYLQEADFIRLRNLTLGYTLPESAIEKIGLSKLRVYFTGFNVLTITGYDGYDPEARSDAGSTAAGRGIDFYSAPAASTYSIGFNINF